MTRTNIYVPYAEKDEAKALGARWDADNRTWYVPENLNIQDFEKWLNPKEPEKPAEPNISSSYFYLLQNTEKCWNCHKETVVAAIMLPENNFSFYEDEDKEQEIFVERPTIYDITYINPEALQQIKNLHPNFDYIFSATKEGYFFANTCSHCHKLQGDFFLHQEPDGAFWGLDEDKLKQMKSTQIDTELVADAGLNFNFE